MRKSTNLARAEEGMGGDTPCLVEIGKKLNVGGDARSRTTKHMRGLIYFGQWEISADSLTIKRARIESDGGTSWATRVILQ